MALLKKSAAWWAALALLVLPLRGASAGPEIAREYQIKAVFLFNFSQFVSWPPAAFSTADAPLVIGILGADPFGRYLDSAVAGETVDGRRLVVERYRRIEEIKLCHILYISSSESGQLDQIFEGLKGRSILTVSDLEAFAGHGGMIQLVNENNKIRMKINLQAARAVDLTISSKLLRRGGVIAAGKD